MGASNIGPSDLPDLIHLVYGNVGDACEANPEIRILIDNANNAIIIKNIENDTIATYNFNGFGGLVYAETVTTVAATPKNVSHGLGTSDVQVQCRRTSDDKVIIPDEWVIVDANNITVETSTALTLRVVVQG